MERQWVERWAPTEEVRGGKMSRMTNMISAAEGNVDSLSLKNTIKLPKLFEKSYRTIKQWIDLYVFVFFLHKST